MKYHITENKLYINKTYIGYVRYINYRDNGRHGYGISKVKDQSMLREFEAYARRCFPNAENPYIDYLDKIYKDWLSEKRSQ